MARFHSRGMRRKTQWAGFGNATVAAPAMPLPVAVTAAAPAAILSQGAIIAGGSGFADEEVTITRMIGRLMVRISGTTQGLEASYAIGVIVARNEAITAGIASLPSPESDPDAEWLGYWQGSLKNANNALVDGPVSSSFLDFDLRSQRVMRNGQSIVWVGHAETNTIVMAANGRYLAKLT